MISHQESKTFKISSKNNMYLYLSKELTFQIDHINRDKNVIVDVNIVHWFITLPSCLSRFSERGEP